MKNTKLTQKKLNELAWQMFGRGYGACNADEKAALVESFGKRISIAAKQVRIERGFDGSLICSAIVGGILRTRQYYYWPKAKARQHFMNNPIV